MTKTATQIVDDVIEAVRESDLLQAVSGDVFPEKKRPKDSELEDIIVIFTAGLPYQIQSGVVTINIYVPYVDPYDDGIWTADTERVKEVEALAQTFVDSLTANRSRYRFQLSETIHPADDEAIRQSFVVVKLEYNYF